MSDTVSVPRQYIDCQIYYCDLISDRGYRYVFFDDNFYTGDKLNS